MTSFAEILAALEEQYSAVVSNPPIPAERRLKFRYPLALSVRFRALSGTSSISGAGRTVNVSSRGVLVVSQHAVSQHDIRVGARLELKIEWPPLLDRSIPLQLFALGRVVRCRAIDFAAAFEQHEFRTMRSSSQPPAGSGGRVLEWPAR